MNHSEFSEKLKNIVANPDTMLPQIESLIEEVKEDFTQIETLTARTQTMDERIRNLQDTNIALFLKQTAPNTPGTHYANDDNSAALLDTIINEYKGVKENGTTEH